MTQMDPKFLRDIQRAGWLIRFVDEGSAIVGCPRQGCGTMLKLRSGVKIPDACGRMPEWEEVIVTDNASLTRALKNRRVMLGLSIAEAEECAGVATDHWAKAEGNHPQRQMMSQIVCEMAAALGYDLILRPRSEGLPTVTLGVISRTRARTEARRRMARRRGAQAPE